MAGKRKKLANLLDSFGGFKCLMLARPLLGSRLTILAYHRILPSNLLVDFERDMELVSATSEGFETQIQHLKKYYSIISFSDLKECEVSGAPLPKNPLIITFDDGFEDNYKIAFPILDRHQVKATFFISTDYIGTKNSFWFDRIYSNLMLVNDEKFVVAGQEFTISDQEDEKENEVREVLHCLLNSSNGERLEFFSRLDSSSHEEAPMGELDLPMSWEEVVEMSDSGMEIGSHTKSHPVLSKVSGPLLEQEIAESKSIIEEKTGKEVIAIAYPVGGRFAYSDEIKKMAMDSGYQYGLSYVQDVNSLNFEDRFDLKRVHIEAYHDGATFKLDVLAPPKWG